MASEKTKATVLWIAGSLSLSMGAFHFWLPTLFGWHQGMASAPTSLQWALQSLNFFWSLLTLLAGVLVVVLAQRRAWQEEFGQITLFVLAAYWAGHAAYLVLKPFPLPASLTWLGACFVVFALVQMVLHAWPALATGRSASSIRSS